MQKLKFFSLVVWAVFFVGQVCGGVEIYVSPVGSDENAGNSAEVGAGEDGPVRTPERAVEIASRFFSDGERKVTVHFRGGWYFLDKTWVLGPECTGGKGSLVLRNYKDEEPIFSSAVRVEGWKKLNPRFKPEGLSDKSDGKVYVADMPEGVEKFYTMYEGIYRLARARGEGFKPTQGAKDEGISRSELHYPEGTIIRSWDNIEDVEIFIRPWCLWSMNILPLAKVDVEKRIAYTAVEGSYPLTRERFNRFPEQSVWVENVPEAMDRAGEWFVNTKTRKIYLWVSSETDLTNIYVPRLRELVAVMGDEQEQRPVRNVTFDGLTFVHGDRDVWDEQSKGLQHDWEMYDTDNAMMRLRWADTCTVRNCAFVGGGGGGVRLDLYAQGITVENCEISWLGGTGVLLCGYGPGKKDLSKDNRIYNNHIHHIGELNWAYQAIMVWQSGHNHIAHNHIHNTPYNGVSFGGASIQNFARGLKGVINDRELSRTVQVEDCWELLNHKGQLTWADIMPYLHATGNVFEYNEMHHCIEVMGDGNPIYVRMVPPGNIIRRNYIHDVYGSHDTITTAVRADDAQWGTEFVENVIHRCVAGGICLKGGNLVRNNIIADIFGAGDPLNVHNVKPIGYILMRLSSYAYDHSGYVGHSGAEIYNNILYHTGNERPVFYGELNENWPEDYYEKVRKVLVAPQVDRNILYWTKDTGYVEQYIERMQRDRGDDEHSVVADPMFVDPAVGDFRFRSGSPVEKMGIVELDTREMGLDEERFPQRLKKYWW